MRHEHIVSKMEEILGMKNDNNRFDLTFGELGQDSVDFLKTVGKIESAYKDIHFDYFFVDDASGDWGNNSMTPNDVVSYIHRKLNPVDPIIANF